MSNNIHSPSTCKVDTAENKCRKRADLFFTVTRRFACIFLEMSFCAIANVGTKISSLGVFQVYNV